MQTHDSDFNAVSTPTSGDSNLQKPGVLQGKVSLTLQTERAQQFVYGRRKAVDKSSIWGLLTFAEKIKPLWLASSQDDPYADWWLVKVDELMQDCKNSIHECATSLNTLLDTQCVLQVDTAQSVNPLRIALRFANPYPFRAAHLLAEYDQLMCLWMTVQHVGVVIDEALEERLRASAKKLRAVYASPQSYQRMGVSRALYCVGDSLTDNARALMGDVPDDILSERRAPKLRPKKTHVPKMKKIPHASPEGDHLLPAENANPQTPAEEDGINTTEM